MALLAVNARTKRFTLNADHAYGDAMGTPFYRWQARGRCLHRHAHIIYSCQLVDSLLFSMVHFQKPWLYDIDSY